MATPERAAVTAAGHLGTVSDWMTPTVASKLEFHELVPYKTLLKRYFSAAPWSSEDEQRLSDLVASKLEEGWQDELLLPGGLVVAHGVDGGRYWMQVTGTAGADSSLWDRVFSGPIVPEPTPHPRKVKFTTGGKTAAGVWYRRGDDVADERVRRLLAEPDITDVMVAGDFVTIGLARSSTWEDRLDPLLDLVGVLFPHGERGGGAMTRDELVVEGRALDVTRPDQLHLLDPDDPAARTALQEAQASKDARVRRIAVAVLAESRDDAVARGALRAGFADPARIVRRVAVDVAADREDEALRDLFESALGSDDAWQRWKAVRALGDLGVEPSREAVESLAVDEDFQVRFEVERLLRRRDAP